MNRPLRRLAVVVMAMFALLMANANYLQAIESDSLSEDPRNRRTLIDRYDQERGLITAGPDGREVLAKSKATDDDQLKYLRQYPKGRKYAPITGFFSQFSAAGLERAKGSMLDGSDPSLAVRNFIDIVTGEERRGADVETTILPKAQDAAWNGIKQYGKGAVVALEPKTGKILAMVSQPSYDPNPLASHNVKEILQADKALDDDPDKPKLNRTIEDTYAPGSVFKVVTAAAAIEEFGLTAESLVDAPANLVLPGTGGRTLPNAGGHSCGAEQMPLQFTLEKSCNTSFGKLGIDLGSDKLIEQAKRFGVGEKIEVPMDVVASNIPEGMSKDQVARAAIGQESDQLSPMQMAMIAAGIANGGVVMKPNLVNTVVGSDGQEIESFAPEELDRAITENTASELNKMMIGVAQRGTGTAGQIPGVPVAAKTGTAETADGKPPHAWYISFAPANDPKVAVAVFVQSGGRAGSEASGGLTAGPIARDVMRAVLGQ